MTTVLIVDDEALAIQAIRRSVNWGSLGVDRVLDAANGKEAQKILQKESVQVLVCDLEMPQMSGIELLEWMHGECPEVESVILTCHESFSMAQKAMGLGCVEYVLKPIAPTELTASIRHALALWKEQQSMRNSTQAYEKGRSLRRDQYLQDILEKNILSTSESLFNCAQKFDLDLDFSETIRIAKITVLLSDPVPQTERELIGYAVCNIAKELWETKCSGWTSQQRRGGQNFLLIGTGIDPEEVRQFREELIKTCQETLRQQVMVSVAPPCKILGFCSAVETLEENDSASVEASHSAAEDVRVYHWKNLLLQDEAESVQREITAELNLLPLHATQERMQQTAQELLRSMELVWKERGCPAEDMMRACPESNFETVPQFLSWVQWSLSRTEQALHHSPGEDQVIQQIREYIELNLHQELTRESIAAAVYLNPDYTARLFKRKTGQSLNDYIQSKRISLARQLLSGTDMPVGDLAVALGYSSFSHFTKLFKSIEGVTPSEYRRMHTRVST